MEIGKAFTFITEDEDYVQKLAIGVGVIVASLLLSVAFIGFLGFFILAGYGIRLLQNVRDGVAKPLPAWDDWGGDLRRGFNYTVVTLIWGLPALLLAFPMVAGAAISDNSSGAGEFFGVAIALCAGCLVFLYALFISLVQPAFAISFARDERIRSGLMLTEIWRWTQQNLGQVVIAGLVVVAISFFGSLLATIAGLLLIGVGLLLTIPLASLLITIFQHHLFGQLAHDYPMYPSTPRTAAPAAPMPDLSEIVPPAESPASPQDDSAV